MTTHLCKGTEITYIYLLICVKLNTCLLKEMILDLGDYVLIVSLYTYVLPLQNDSCQK